MELDFWQNIRINKSAHKYQFSFCSLVKIGDIKFITFGYSIVFRPMLEYFEEISFLNLIIKDDFKKSKL